MILMIKKFLSPSQYANDLLTAHKNDYETVKKILINDRGALGVVSALLLAINLSSLTIPSESVDPEALLSMMHLILHLISAMFALACIWIGSQQYLKINMLPPEAAYQYKSSMYWVEEPIAFLTGSLATLPWAVACEIYLTYGSMLGKISFSIVSVIYCFTLIIVATSALRYHFALNMIYKKITKRIKRASTKN